MIAKQPPTDRVASPPGKRFAVLDAWRGLLALLVALGHLAYWTGNNDSLPLSFILAVDVFFILSGFVIANSIFRGNRVSEWIGQFAVRRVFRIFPGYLVVALISAMLGWALRGFQWAPVPLAALANVALLLQNTGIMPGLPQGWGGQTAIGIAWTLSVEIWLGLVFFSAVALVRFRLRWLLTLLICSISLPGLIIVSFSPSFMNVHYATFGVVTFGVLRGFIGFSTGVLCYLAYQRIRSLWFATLLEVGLIVLIIWTYVFSGWASWTQYLAPVYGAGLIFIYAYEAGIVSRLLRLPMFQLMGAWSFGIYICHPIFIDLYKRLEVVYAPVQIAIYVITVVLFAAALHAVVERPMIRLGARITRKGRGGDIDNVPAQNTWAKLP